MLHAYHPGAAMPSFRLVGLPFEPFAPLFKLSDAHLSVKGAIRVIARQTPGYPCRVSLEDAEVGEELLLLRYQHQPGNSPYRASGPIYVRRHAIPRVLKPGEAPEYVTRRLISVRAYDSAHRMLNAEVCDGIHVAAEIQRQFRDKRIAYIHLHNAKPGCFSCRVIRAE
jgi:Protein of unknown function (DUF1203)